MKLGSLATIGAYAPQNLMHIIFENCAYESTGGQPTVSPSVDFAGAAIACGYPKAFSCDDLSGFETAVTSALASPGPHLIHMRIARGTIEGLGRPKIAPVDVAKRFKAFLATQMQPGDIFAPQDDSRLGPQCTPGSVRGSEETRFPTATIPHDRGRQI